MKILICGCGSIGRRHASILLQLGHSVFLHSSRLESEEVLELVAKGAYVFPLIRGVDLDFDCIFICNISSLHLDLATYFVSQGQNIFVEKPLHTTANGLSRLVAESEKMSILSHIGCNLRYRFGPREIFEALQMKKFGPLLSLQIQGGMRLEYWHPDEDHRLSYSAKQTLGGGVLLDFIHEIDLIRWLVGDIASVSCITLNSGSLEIETEECADAIMLSRNGVVVNLHVDYLRFPFQRRIEAICEKGVIEWCLSRDSICFSSFDGDAVEVITNNNAEEHNDMYVRQNTHFLELLETRSRSENDLVNASGTLAVVDALKQSAENNGNKVRVVCEYK